MPDRIGMSAGARAGMMTWTRAHKDDAGARSITAVARSSATNSLGATVSLGNSCPYYLQVFETDPNTSTAWTVRGSNSSEFGWTVIT
jgi:hypothetical protein